MFLAKPTNALINHMHKDIQTQDKSDNYNPIICYKT